jgi:hypothetical protein
VSTGETGESDRVRGAVIDGFLYSKNICGNVAILAKRVFSHVKCEIDSKAESCFLERGPECPEKEREARRGMIGDARFNRMNG